MSQKAIASLSFSERFCEDVYYFSLKCLVEFTSEDIQAWTSGLV